MSTSLQAPQTPNFFVKLPPHFETRRNSLKVALPSHGDNTLHEELSSRLQSFRDVMTAASALNGNAGRCYRHFLWITSRKTGLILPLLKAIGHGATSRAEEPIIFRLLTCINPILAAGIKSNYIFSPESDDHAEIIRAAAEVIPKAISACWRKLSRKICQSEAPEKIDLLHLEYLVKLVCLANQLIEQGRDPNATVRPMESDALRELELRMKNSEALEDLMLQFLIHRGESSKLTTRVVASFSKIFGSGLPPLTDRSQCFNNLGMALRDILPSKGDANRVDCSRYSAIVDTVYTVLSSPQHWVYLRVDGLVLEKLGALTLCCLLSGGYWEFVKSEENILGEEELLKLSIRVLVIACTSLVSLLVFQKAFVPLVARGLLAWQVLGDNALGDTNEPGSYDWKDVLGCRIKAIGKSLQENSKEFSNQIIASTGFTTTLDTLRYAKSLRPGATQSTNQPIRIWKEFCQTGQLEERAYRRDRYNNELGGCKWFKCPLYGTETLAKDNCLVCATCKKVAYCGQLCQDGDRESHDPQCRKILK